MEIRTEDLIAHRSVHSLPGKKAFLRYPGTIDCKNLHLQISSHEPSS
jgi:hypothetical protein